MEPGAQFLLFCCCFFKLSTYLPSLISLIFSEWRWGKLLCFFVLFCFDMSLPTSFSIILEYIVCEFKNWDFVDFLLWLSLTIQKEECGGLRLKGIVRRGKITLVIILSFLVTNATKRLGHMSPATFDRQGRAVNPMYEPRPDLIREGEGRFFRLERV